MTSPLVGHPPWRQLLLVSLALPLLIVLAVLCFAWPAAQLAPRGVPLGIVNVGNAGSVRSPRRATWCPAKNVRVAGPSYHSRLPPSLAPDTRRGL